jgi:ribonuclease HI
MIPNYTAGAVAAASVNHAATTRLEVYADGSCLPNPGRGGWAFVVFQNGAEIHVGTGQADATTNNRMEITAVLKAIEWLGDRPARIYSDSQYVVNGGTSWCKAWVKRGWMRKDKHTKALQPVVNTDLWQRLMAARHDGHSLHWVRGHSTSAGNIRADALAEAARRGAPA